MHGCVTAFLRRLAAQVYPYLDNWLIMGWSKLYPVLYSFYSTFKVLRPIDPWRQVYPLPITEDRVYRGSVGLYPGQSVSPRVKVPICLIVSDTPQVSSNHNSPKPYEVPRAHFFMSICNTTCETAPQIPQCTSKPSSSGHCAHSTFLSSGFTELVVRSSQ